MCISEPTSDVGYGQQLYCGAVYSVTVSVLCIIILLICVYCVVYVYIV